MKQVSNESKNTLIKLKDNLWLERQRVAGKVTAKALSHLLKLVKEKNKLTTLDLSKEAEKIILREGCLPTFKGYKGFPEACCISVNKQLVHGIPGNYVLQEGDVVSFDLGATYQGVIADSAVTCIFGTPLKEEHQVLIDTTERALREAIKKIKSGIQLGIVGQTISKISKDKGFSVVNSYGGHGICQDKDGNGIPHAQPFVSNKDSNNNGIRFQAGMTIAIEPLLVIGNDESTAVDKDGWTVWTKDISCHMEHTIFIHKDKVEIITERE